MAEIAAALVEAVDAALGPWVIDTVTRFRPDLRAEATVAADRCRADVVPRLRALVSQDIDAQASTPLAELRRAAGHVAGVLERAGVPAPERDPFEARATPADVYGVGPGAWSDLGEEVGGLGLAWGAAKAHLHLRRHRPQPPE